MSQRSQDRILLLQYPTFLHLKSKQTVTQNAMSHSQLATAVSTWHSQSHYSPSMFSPPQASSHCCCWRKIKQGDIIFQGQSPAQLPCTPSQPFIVHITPAWHFSGLKFFTHMNWCALYAQLAEAVIMCQLGIWPFESIRVKNGTNVLPPSNLYFAKKGL